MKKIIMLLLLVSMSVFAGQWDEEEDYYQGGLKIGIGGSTVIGDDVSNTNTNLSYQLGGFFVIPITNIILFQSELLMDSKGMKTTQTQTELFYITVPLILSIKANENFKIYGGGYVSILMVATFTNDDINSEEFGDTDVTNYYNNMDFGASVGAMFKKGQFVFDFRYNHGFSKLDNNQKADIFNQQYMLSFGYLF